MASVCLIYNADGRVWRDYIRDEIRNANPDPTQPIKFRLSQDVNMRLPSINKAKVAIVIFTPGHKDFLANHPDFNYRDIILESSRTIILSCGEDLSELDSLDAEKQPLSRRFFEFSNWKKFDADRVYGKDGIVEEVHRMLQMAPQGKTKTKDKVKLVKTTAKCEEPTDIILSFENQISADSKVQIFLTDPEEDINLPAQYLNPYTFIFTAPEHMEGEVTVKVLVNDQEILVSPSTLTYVSNVNQFLSLTQIYMELLTKLMDSLKNKIPISEIDSKFSGIFHPSDMEQIPLEAFELLFGVYRFAASESSDFRFPSLLHFAANFGLQEFSSQLSDLPDATLALSITNSQGRLPETLALNNKHIQLANFLEDFREVELDDIYVEHVRDFGYVNIQPGCVDDSGYLKTQVRTAKTSGYVNMKGRAEIKADYSSIYDIQQQQQQWQQQQQQQQQATPAPSDRRSNNKHTPPGVRPLNQLQNRSPANAMLAVAPAWYAVPVVPPVSVKAGSSQEKLIDIIEMYKRGETTIPETELLYQEWQLSFKSGGRSFKEKQEKLAKMQEEVKKAKKRNKTDTTQQVETYVNVQGKKNQTSGNGSARSSGYSSSSNRSSGASGCTANEYVSSCQQPSEIPNLSRTTPAMSGLKPPPPVPPKTNR